MSQQNSSRWSTVQIEAVLLDKVESYIGQRNCTYNSKTDFVSNAVRKELVKAGVIKS